jgi:hypothetical protein
VLDARDVDEVIDWAERTARTEQTFCLYVEHQDGDSPGLIHLSGDDPSRAE